MRSQERIAKSESYFLSRHPAAKAPTAASSHSIRHSWIACQSTTVRALKNTLTPRAPTTQSTPTRKAMTAGVVSPSRSPSEANSARPGISNVRAVLTPRSGRLAPQAWQKSELTMNSVPQRQVEFRSGLATALATGIGGRQKSCSARSTASAIRNSFFSQRKRITKASCCKDDSYERAKGEGSLRRARITLSKPEFSILHDLAGLRTYALWFLAAISYPLSVTAWVS